MHGPAGPLFLKPNVVYCDVRMLWVMYDPAENSWQEGLPIAISKTLKRRYFLVEKAKNANVIGTAQQLPS